MTKEQIILQLETRKNILESRGSHNNAIVKKVERQIRNLKKKI